MSNLYQPYGGDSPGDHPTEQFWRGPAGPGPAGPGPGGPGGPAGPGGPGHPGGGFPDGAGQPGWDHLRKDNRKALHWTVGLTVAALLVGGGVFAGAELAGQPPGGTAALSAASPSAASWPAGQAALLNATLSAANSPGALAPVAVFPAAVKAGVRAAAGRCARVGGSAVAARRSGFPRIARAARIAGRRCFIRRRVFRFFLLRGVDGQFTLRAADGLRTIAFERGVIESVNSGASMVVKASDGTTWTWDFTGDTVVRDWGGIVSEPSLSAGEPVWAGGPVTGGAKDARLVVVRPPAPPAPPGG